MIYQITSAHFEDDCVDELTLNPNLIRYLLQNILEGTTKKNGKNNSNYTSKI